MRSSPFQRSHPSPAARLAQRDLGVMRGVILPAVYDLSLFCRSDHREPGQSGGPDPSSRAPGPMTRPYPAS